MRASEQSTRVYTEKKTEFEKKKKNGKSWKWKLYNI